MRVPPLYNPAVKILVWGLAALLGAGVALGQAPFGLWWVALVALSLLIAMGQATSPFRVGLAAGTGYAALAMFWIVEPFFVEPEIYGWMAPFALVFMALGMGLFWALGMSLGARLGGASVSRAAGVAVGLFGADLLRSYLFTGLPWVLFGHIWIDTPLSQGAALVGAMGLSALTLCLAVLPWLMPRANWRLPAAGVSAAVIAGLWGAGSWQLAQPVPPRATPVTLRIVQPNAPQDLKWRPEYAEEFFFRHLDLTAQPPAPGKAAPDLVLWPETAVPFLLDRAGDGLTMIAEAARGAPVAVGIQREEGLRYFNSLAMIEAGGKIGPVYDKVHLVPFGEYIPFGDELARFGISAFAAREGNGYSAGTERKLLDLGRLGLVQPLICYEAVFPQDMHAGRRPDWLLQITNDAWFGEMSGPVQHLVQARFRAIEFGLPLARSANTGISALIDARGRVIESLGMGQQGVIDAALPGSLAAPPYARWGDLPWLAGLIAAVALVWGLGRKSRVDRRRIGG
ncbi:apolipoprotein N-acyltransferase [Rhodobacter capsulatus]|uniref:apolipoprotein N-acyltransferase n=1 Tax=Rhodobacter capsulatus TaxID=1061 RepID=UPI0006DC3B95|nr:apolipoprotein N-acyltransferase [Rhodobacter capsulatus]KQB15193.1 hypothetical protein AP071_15130 [Rhodobacter capsulatus]KQB16911.1 hypothetical protein AP073_09840 [Rhodobacter capsulatus]PZX23705.1 apolipoprotein N-acyltransferase [Rhodobacter capsulatus]QNR62342.1 apolipoprotein N-acyltransferase [Rhodobacter capsulatus]